MTAVDSEMKPSWYKDPTWIFKRHYLLPRVSQWLRGKESACNVGNVGLNPGLGRSPGEEMAAHSSILAWRIPWTEEPGGGGCHSPRGGKESDMTERLNNNKTFLPRLFGGSYKPSRLQDPVRVPWV